VRAAFRILDIAAKNNFLTSKNPMVRADATIHLSCVMNKEKILQLKISKVSGISAVTIRDRTKEIKKKSEAKLMDRTCRGICQMCKAESIPNKIM